MADVNNAGSTQGMAGADDWDAWAEEDAKRVNDMAAEARRSNSQVGTAVVPPELNPDGSLANGG